MKINFKIKVLPLAFLAVLSQTACVDTEIDIENKRLKIEQKCQVSSDYEYSLNFRGFSHSKKVVVREMANGKILQEKPGDFVNNTSLLDEKNQNYYQIIVDDRYLFTLSEIKINAIHMGRRPICHIKEWKVNEKKYSDTRILYKKDAVILPVTTP